MSSNTLRGIGQEGEDGGEGKDKGQDKHQGEIESGRELGAERLGEEGRKLSDRLQELRGIRSLDSTIPGTRSLDSSVPGGQPSLDAKVPTLATTLMGIALPAVSTREQGTVQGRDVHLPVEAKRVAGVLSIAGSRDSVPDPIEPSVPTVANPVRTAVLAESEAESIHGNARGQPDLNSHAPWYDQEPLGGDVYEDPKSNTVGRVAIGVAVVAGISVVLFAAARLRNLDNAAEHGAEQAAEVLTPPPVSVPNQASGPSVPPTPAPPAPRSGDPAPEPTAGTDVPSMHPVPVVESKPAVPRFAGIGARRPSAGAPGSAGPRSPTVPTGQGATRPAGKTPHPGPGGVANAMSEVAAARGSKPNAAVAAVPTALTAPPGTLPTPPPQPPARAVTEAEPPTPAPTPPTPKHPTPRGKTTYDPDSTLPLNLD